MTGCSVAMHLARAGWTDVLLIEKGELTSGSTAHAAGLVTMFNPSPTMMAFRRYSVELYGELGVFESVGSIRIASSPESLKELQRGVSRARAIGLDVELLSPARPCSGCLRPAPTRSTAASGCPVMGSSIPTPRRTRSRTPAVLSGSRFARGSA